MASPEKRKRRRIRAVAVLPTMFTLGNLVSGFFAIVLASRVDSRVAGSPSDMMNCALSAGLIFLGMLFDALDGRVARLARSTSNFGAELDSLCDMVSFGVAPAFLLVKMTPQFTLLPREAVWTVSSMFAVCVALRLARFNVETGQDDDHMKFNGLPSPAGAAAVASFAFMLYALGRDDHRLVYASEINTVVQTLLPFYALAVALLMVSRIPYPHVVNQLFRGRRSFSHVVGIVFALAIAALAPSFALPILCVALVLWGPLRLAVRTLTVRRRPEETPAA